MELGLTEAQDTTRLLGTINEVQARNAPEFSELCSPYMESGTSKSLSNKGALWPLIRRIRIECCSPTLSSGAVLVDLPGVADSNAARGSIAKEYLKRCDHVWIVAPITRAVDDKTAKGTILSLHVRAGSIFVYLLLLADLLGEAFKAQLMSELHLGLDSNITLRLTLP